MNTIAENLKQEAVEAWRAAQEYGNEFTATDLGLAVSRFAEAAGVDPAQAMKIVRAAGQAEIDAEASPNPPQATPAAEPEPGTPADARKAAWHELSQAFQADEHAPSEETAAALGRAAFRYARVAGMDHAAALKKIRDAVHGRGPARKIYLSYSSVKAGRLAIGSQEITTTRLLVGFEDVRALQDELIAALKDPSFQVLGWSTYDAPR